MFYVQSVSIQRIKTSKCIEKRRCFQVAFNDLIEMLLILRSIQREARAEVEKMSIKSDLG